MTTALKHTNRGYSILAADMNNSSDPVTFSVASGHGARFPAAFPFHVSIFNPATPDTREIIEITARTTDSMTGTRASEGTSKIAHTAGDAVWLDITSGLLDLLETLIAEKLPLAGGGPMSGPIAMGTQKITGMGDPTAAQDAATMAYVDAVFHRASATFPT